MMFGGVSAEKHHAIRTQTPVGYDKTEATRVKRLHRYYIFDVEFEMTQTQVGQWTGFRFTHKIVCFDTHAAEVFPIRVILLSNQSLKHLYTLTLQIAGNR
jgi:hypothetical protein